MEPTLGLLGGGGGGTEVCSYQNEAEIELGLGLSLSGSGVKGKGYFGKIMTAKDLLPSGGGFAGTKRGAADFVGSPPDQGGIKGYSASASAAVRLVQFSYVSILVPLFSVLFFFKFN